MSEEGPKLYANKPKKAQLKQGKDFAVPSSSSSSSSATTAASYSMASQGTPPPPQPPKESFARRYKFIWPLLLTINLAVGAYVFMRTKKKDTRPTDEDNVTSATQTVVTTTQDAEKPLPPPSILEQVKPREPIPLNQQRELYKWMLEEKRKIKPRDSEEKKRIDEEKAVLKQFIRAKSVPTL